MKRCCLFLAVLLMLAACSSNDMPERLEDNNVFISLTACPASMAATRATRSLQSTDFDDGETFYAYFPSDVTIGNATYACGTTFTKQSDGSWTPANKPFFNKTSTSCDVYAYYGKSGGSPVTNSTTSFSVAPDQTGEADYKASDLMYATIASLQKTKPIGSLTFAHLMAQIKVKITPVIDVTTINAVKIIGGHRTVALTMPGCTIGSTSGDLSTTQSITMYSSTTSGEVTYYALIPPQTISGDFLQIETDAGTVTYSLANIMTFSRGECYTFDLAVTKASKTFNYTGSEQTFEVPATGWYTIQAYGAEGGESLYNMTEGTTPKSGGKGGYSSISYHLTKGETLYIYCGGKGGNGTRNTGGTGGWNGGGAGGKGYTASVSPCGGGGGGATHVATSAIGAISDGNSLFTGTAANPTAISGLILVAAGGGGGSVLSCTAGAGGGTSGGRGTNTGNTDNYSSGEDIVPSTGSHGGAGREGKSNHANQTYGGSGGHGGGFKAVASLNGQYQTYGGFGGSSWGDTTHGTGYTSTSGGATEGGNGKVVISWLAIPPQGINDYHQDNKYW